MRKTLTSLKALAKKLTGKNSIPGDTVDEVIAYAEANFNVTASRLALKSPDNSVWDIKIANDGTISGTKRT